MLVRVKTFIEIKHGDIETVVGNWLNKNPARVVAVSQSQSSEDAYCINLTIFWEYDYRQNPPR